MDRGLRQGEPERAGVAPGGLEDGQKLMEPRAHKVDSVGPGRTLGHRQHLGEAKALGFGHVRRGSALCRTLSQAVAVGVKFRREGPSGTYVGVTMLR